MSAQNPVPNMVINIQLFTIFTKYFISNIIHVFKYNKPFNSKLDENTNLGHVIIYLCTHTVEIMNMYNKPI